MCDCCKQAEVLKLKEENARLQTLSEELDKVLHAFATVCVPIAVTLLAVRFTDRFLLFACGQPCYPLPESH